MKESPNLEFKREITKTFLKTVSAFANYGTGKIIFGIDDNGSPVGVSDPEAAALSIENAINDALSPVPRFQIDIDGNAGTVTLTVFEGGMKPYLCSGKAYRRANTSTVAVSRLENSRLSLLGFNTSFDALESAQQNLLFTALEKESCEKMGVKQLDRNALVSLELSDPKGTFNNAAALLADQNQFPGIDIVRFGDSINIMLSRQTIERTSLLLQMKRALEIFEEYYRYEKIVGERRVTRYLVPPEAFREAIANALVHRCWDVKASTKVSLFSDRIEVTSPGGLPDGITEEEYLSGGPSVSRNPILANVFYRLGYIERFGTGIPRIIHEYADLNVSPQFQVKEASITVILPVNDSIAFSSDEQLVLEAIPKGVSLARAAISAATDMSKDKTIRILAELMEKDAILRTGSGPATKYSRK